MSTPMNDSILKMDGSLVVMLVVVLVLMYQVFMVDRVDINYLKMAHSKEVTEGFRVNNNLVSNPGANRFDGGESSGQWQGGALVLDNSSYRNPSTSSFLGGGEPPVFYDIGNLRAMKANEDASGYTYNPKQNRGSLRQVPVVPAMPVVSSSDKVAAAIEGLWLGADKNNEIAAY
jgi:hypothetical protein